MTLPIDKRVHFVKPNTNRMIDRVCVEFIFLKLTHDANRMRSDQGMQDEGSDEKAKRKANKIS